LALYLDSWDFHLLRLSRPTILLPRRAEALKAKDTKTAVSLYEQAVAADPENAELLTDYAGSPTVRIGEVNFMAQGMVAGFKMLKAYQRSVEIDPTHVSGWIGLSRYYLNAPPIAGGSADKAEKYAREVLALVPFLGNTEMGLVEEKRGNNDKAAEYFQASLDENPDYGEAKAGLERVTKEAGA
jgi:tetratricopeptide (TPR) repeat protein